MGFRGFFLATRLVLAMSALVALPRPVDAAPQEQAQEPGVNRRPAHRAPETQSRSGGETARNRNTKPPAVDQKPHPAPPVVAAPPAPKPPREPPPAEVSGPAPKLPRFAALKTDETNMRKGPGQRYPIDWVYKRRDLPVEVEREYDVWRYIRDPEGVQGWVHQVTLSDRRTFLITGKDATLRADANDTSAAVALLRIGVIGRLRECAEGSKWCQVQVGGFRGYLRRDQFWGLLPDEVVSPS